MKVCIVSDSHDNWQLLANAVAHAKDRGAAAVLHCGDVVAPSTLKALRPYELPVHVIHGNNTGDLVSLGRMGARGDKHLHYYGQDAGLELAGKRIFLVHYPHYGRAMATTGDWDLVCCGHDHRGRIEQIANIKGAFTTLANPGTVGGVGAPATYIMADLASMQLELVEIAGQAQGIPAP